MIVRFLGCIYKRKGTNNETCIPKNRPNKITNEQLKNSKLTGIKIAHLNINGLRNKIDLLNAELSNYDIICVSETKLSDTVETQKLLIDGLHQPICKDRRFDNGDGLLVYIKN